MNKLKLLKTSIWLFPAMLLMASCVSNKKYMNAQRDIERLKNDSLQLVQASIVANEEIEKLNQEKTSYKSELMMKQEELLKKESALAESRKKAMKVQNKLNDIASDLEVFNTDYSKVTVEDGHVKLVMDQAILFDQGSTKINFQGDILLERLAQTLKRVDDVEIAVEGHTDTVPVTGKDDNWDLSVDRSIAVIGKLTKAYGVSPEKLIAAGKSKFDPIVANDTPKNMAKNRRVEFLIIPDLESIESEID